MKQYQFFYLLAAIYIAPKADNIQCIIFGVGFTLMAMYKHYQDK